MVLGRVFGVAAEGLGAPLIEERAGAGVVELDSCFVGDFDGVYIQIESANLWHKHIHRWFTFKDNRWVGPFGAGVGLELALFRFWFMDDIEPGLLRPGPVDIPLWARVLLCVAVPVLGAAFAVRVGRSMIEATTVGRTNMPNPGSQSK